MLKRIFLILAVIGSLLVIGYTVWKGSSEKKSEVQLLAQVSDDALLVLDVQDAKLFQEKLSTGNVLWPDLTSLDFSSSFSNALIEIDSLLSANYQSSPDSAITYTISLHPNGQSGYAWMLCLDGQRLDRNSWLQKAKDLNYSKEVKSVYGEYETQIFIKGEHKLHVAAARGVVYISTERLCLEKHLRLEKNSLIARSEFRKVYETKGSHSMAHVYVNWSSFPNALRHFTPKNSNIHFQDSFAGWAASDVINDANSIYLNGLVMTSDSAQHYLSNCQNQGSGSWEELLTSVPANTAMYSYQHISNFDLWRTDILKSQNSVDDKGLLELLGFGVLRGYVESEISEAFIILPVSSATETRPWLDDHSDAQTEMLGFKVWNKTDLNSLIGIYGEQIIPWEEGHSALNGSQLIVCKSESELRAVLLQIRNQNTLSEDAPYQQLEKDIDDESVLTYYYNIARSSHLIQNHWTSKYAEQLINKPEKLQQFQALVVQYEPASDGLFHQNILLRHNPVYKKETSSIWEAELDTTLASNLYLVKNHYSNQYEILIQNARNELELHDNTGKKLWSIPLNGRIISSIQQVDLFKNDKLQLAFNTLTEFIIIDRNGEYLDGFPVQLSDTASSQLSIMDYDENRNYRFLIATSDGKLHNYDRDGKEVKGWKHKESSEPIIGNMRHFTIAKKDYITTIGAGGQLNFLERNGKVRYGGAKSNLSDYGASVYQVKAGKNIKETHLVYSNKAQEIVDSEVQGAVKVIANQARLSTFLPDRYYSNSEGVCSIYNFKGELKRSINHGLDNVRIQILDEHHIGIANLDTEMYFVYDETGSLLPGLPLPGQVSALKDINSDGSLDLILSDGKHSLSAYSIN